MRKFSSEFRNFIPVALIMTPKLWIAYIRPEKNSTDSFIFKPSTTGSDHVKATP
jgi:hypothetical protein